MCRLEEGRLYDTAATPNTPLPNSYTSDLLLLLLLTYQHLLHARNVELGVDFAGDHVQHGLVRVNKQGLQRNKHMFMTIYMTRGQSCITYL